jgi:tetratricopeptide (TPR) repeat protein
MRRYLPLALYLSAAICTSQEPTVRKPLSLVMPKGNGRILIPSRPGYELQQIRLYDDGTRPVLQLTNTAKKVDVSYALFPNSTGTSSPKICRDDVLNAATRGLSPVSGLADIKQVKKEDRPLPNGQSLSTASFLLATMADAKVDQQNLFGVAASATTCAEVHISMVSYKPADQPTLDAELASFAFEPDYVASAQDYYNLAGVLYRSGKAYDGAAFYYQRALDTLPPGTPVNARRVVVDQLSMSYGISGQIKQSRAVNETAIKSDPDYPLYYFNLACADAEQHKVDDAKLHLKQAFDRKANTLPGEHLPDPTKDDSILKLKSNREFWAFVQTLK